MRKLLVAATLAAGVAFTQLPVRAQDDPTLVVAQSIGVGCAELWATRSEAELDARLTEFHSSLERFDRSLFTEILGTEERAHQVRTSLAEAQAAFDQALDAAIWDVGQTRIETNLSNIPEVAKATGSVLAADGLDERIRGLEKELAEVETKLAHLKLTDAALPSLTGGVTACAVEQRAWLKEHGGNAPEQPADDSGDDDSGDEVASTGTPQGEMTGRWNADCGDGFVLGGRLRLVLDENGDVMGGLSNDGGDGEMPLSGSFDNGRLSARAGMVGIGLAGTLSGSGSDARGGGTTSSTDPSIVCTGTWSIPGGPA